MGRKYHLLAKDLEAYVILISWKVTFSSASTASKHVDRAFWIFGNIKTTVDLLLETQDWKSCSGNSHN